MGDLLDKFYTVKPDQFHCHFHHSYYSAGISDRSTMNRPIFNKENYIRLDDFYEAHLSKTSQSIIKSSTAIFIEKEAAELIFKKVKWSELDHIALCNSCVKPVMSFDFTPVYGTESHNIKVIIYNNENQEYIKDTNKQIIKLLLLSHVT